MPVDAEGIACCFDRRTARMIGNYRRNGIGKAARSILGYLETQDLTNLESLELGSGVGGLTVELAKRGVVAARGVDLSPSMVEAANHLASESGLGSVARFTVGDGASTHLDKADIVILDAVLCCYPQVDSLILNSTSAARRLYAISVPDDRRMATKLLRPLLPLQKVFFRGSSFRFFLHSASKMFKLIEGQGFTKVFEQPLGSTWLVAIFSSRRG